MHYFLGNKINLLLEELNVGMISYGLSLLVNLIQSSQMLSQTLKY